VPNFQRIYLQSVDDDDDDDGIIIIIIIKFSKAADLFAFL
jgi:hypothetical protein